MLILAISYSIYGMFVCFYLYGRKTDYLRKKYAEEAAAQEQGLPSPTKVPVDPDDDPFDIWRQIYNYVAMFYGCIYIKYLSYKINIYFLLF